MSVTPSRPSSAATEQGYHSARSTSSLREVSSNAPEDVDEGNLSSSQVPIVNTSKSPSGSARQRATLVQTRSESLGQILSPECIGSFSLLSRSDNPTSVRKREHQVLGGSGLGYSSFRYQVTISLKEATSSFTPHLIRTSGRAVTSVTAGKRAADYR
jgi:hypothetical protein